MGKEIEADYVTGRLHVYAQLRNSVGQIWRTDTLVFENYATANIAHYSIAMVEQGTASGYYAADLPPQAGAGKFNVIAKDGTSANPAETDLTIATGEIEWNGTTISDVFSQVLTTQMIESYAALGTSPTLAQAFFEIISSKHERKLPIAVVSTLTETTYKLDGVTAIMTFTLSLDANGNVVQYTRAS